MLRKQCRIERHRGQQAAAVKTYYYLSGAKGFVPRIAPISWNILERLLFSLTGSQEVVGSIPTSSTT